MQATKRHLDYLENEYGIKIERIKAKVPVPLGCKKYGQPFLSKQISWYLDNLQRHGFTFEDGSFEELSNKYPKCISALKWWCNFYDDNSKFNIKKDKYLKEYMIQNPPDFPISHKCCNGAKKQTVSIWQPLKNIELQIIGIRKAEGGARAASHHSCYEPDNSHGAFHYPLFFFTDADKKQYEEVFDIKHSDAYIVYGCKRTGCSGCPFGSGFENELNMLKEYEPNLYIAANNIFKDSYEYTRNYRIFKEQMRNKSLDKECGD